MVQGADLGGRIRELLFVLAKNITKHDPSLSAREIDLAAWMYFGRVLFCTACEGWGLEPPGQVRATADESGAHAVLGALLQQLSRRYGAALAPWEMNHPDRAAELPFIEDTVLRRVVSGTQNPDGSPRWIEQVSAAVETALQREVTRDRGGISTTDRAESVAMGGIKRTPAWLTGYCAGSLARDLTGGIPGGAAPALRILDPSCGCGIYLQEVYRAFSGSTAGHAGGSLAIYGIDRDPRAVDAARILFLLTMCRGGKSDAAPVPLHERIRWGDPIIGRNLGTEEAGWFSGPGSWQHAQPIDWAAHFPEAFAQGGFDGVLGNPPFRIPGVHRALASHLQECYRAYPAGDLAGVYYVEKGLSLLREGGVLCMVLDRRWLRARSGTGLRRLLREVSIREIVDLGTSPVWGQVRAQASILRAGPAPPGGLFRACRVPGGGSGDPVRDMAAHCRSLDQRELDGGGWTLADRRAERLIARITARATPLERYAMGRIHTGFPFPDGYAGIGDAVRKSIVRNDPLAAPLFRRVILRENVAAFRVAPAPRSCVIVVRDAGELAQFPDVVRALREASAGPVPVVYARQEYEQPKLLLAAGDSGIRVAPDRRGGYPEKGVTVIGGSNPYLLGVLNSRLIRFLWAESEEKRTPATLAQLPVYVSDPYDPAERELYTDLLRCVRELRALQTRTSRPDPMDSDRLEAEINHIVYRVYGLSGDEIALVEEYCAP